MALEQAGSRRLGGLLRSPRVYIEIFVASAMELQCVVENVVYVPVCFFSAINTPPPARETQGVRTGIHTEYIRLSTYGWVILRSRYIYICRLLYRRFLDIVGTFCLFGPVVFPRVLDRRARRRPGRTHVHTWYLYFLKCDLCIHD